jgi:hypothetical protein
LLTGKGFGGIPLSPSLCGKSGLIDMPFCRYRLFEEPAQVFLVVYFGQIDSAMHALKGRKIYYGVIDQDDLVRLASAYPTYFKA